MFFLCNPQTPNEHDALKPVIICIAVHLQSFGCSNTLSWHHPLTTHRILNSYRISCFIFIQLRMLNSHRISCLFAYLILIESAASFVFSFIYSTADRKFDCTSSYSTVHHKFNCINMKNGESNNCIGFHKLSKKGNKIIHQLIQSNKMTIIIM